MNSVPKAVESAIKFRSQMGYDVKVCRMVCRDNVCAANFTGHPRCIGFSTDVAHASISALSHRALGIIPWANAKALEEAITPNT